MPQPLKENSEAGIQNLEFFFPIHVLRSVADAAPPRKRVTRAVAVL